MPAGTGTDPLSEVYQGLLARGMKPAMARLTRARKVAAIALKIWKKGERFDPERLKPQSSLSVGHRSSSRETLSSKWIYRPARRIMNDRRHESPGRRLYVN